MEINRRDVLATATGLTLSYALAENAQACAQPAYQHFRPEASEQQRMLRKLQMLHFHWNADRMEDFVRDHCADGFRMHFIADSRDEKWSSPQDVQRVHEHYPEIISDFSGVMFDPVSADLYTMAEFRTTAAPVGEVNACVRQSHSVFAIHMRFAEQRGLMFNTLRFGERIVSRIDVRESTRLPAWFQEHS